MRYDDVARRFKAGWRPGDLYGARVLRKAVFSTRDVDPGLARAMAQVALGEILVRRPQGADGVLDAAEAHATFGYAHLPDQKGVEHLDTAHRLLHNLVEDIPLDDFLRNFDMNVLLQFARVDARLGYHYKDSNPRLAIDRYLGALSVLELLIDKDNKIPWQHQRLADTVRSISFSVYVDIGDIILGRFGDDDLALEYYLAARKRGDELVRKGIMRESARGMYARLAAITSGQP